MTARDTIPGFARNEKGSAAATRPPPHAPVVVFSLKGRSPHDDRDAHAFILDSRSAVDRRRVPSGSGRVSRL